MSKLICLILISACSQSDYYFTYHLANEFNQEQKQTINQAFQDWNELLNCKIFNRAWNRSAYISEESDIPPSIELADDLDTVYLVEDRNNPASYLNGLATHIIPEGTVGYTRISKAGVDGLWDPDVPFGLPSDIQIDIFLWNSIWADPTLARHVIMHELGHWLGLVHSNDPESLMFPYITPDRELRIDPTEDDLLEASYIWQDMCVELRLGPDHYPGGPIYEP